MRAGETKSHKAARSSRPGRLVVYGASGTSVPAEPGPGWRGWRLGFVNDKVQGRLARIRLDYMETDARVAPNETVSATFTADKLGVHWYYCGTAGLLK